MMSEATVSVEDSACFTTCAYLYFSLSISVDSGDSFMSWSVLITLSDNLFYLISTKK